MSGVELRNVTKAFGKALAVQDLNLSVGKGEFLALVGPSGCGKTTTLRMIAGFTRPDSGEILIDGQSVSALGVRERRVGIVFQSYALFPNMTAFENIAFGLRVRKLPEEEVRSRVFRLLEMVGLVDKADAGCRQLSGGQQQRVALARALAIEPRVLLLDEPLSALDAKVRNSLRFEIKKIQRESGITTIYVTHDQEEALSISDRVAVMRSGQIEQVGTPWEVYSNPSSLFVADFVGVSNFLDVELKTDGTVSWKGRTLEVEGAESLPPGPWRLVIRPERLLPVSKDAPAKNVLEGTVAGRVFLGPIQRVALDVLEERILVDLLNTEKGHLSPGETLRVSFSPGDGRLIRRS
jgi:putative spermidine/putrescine transport system ATP-binding protein